MEIETDRLLIKLLTLSQLKLWINNISILEKELKCKYDMEIKYGLEKKYKSNSYMIEAVKGFCEFGLKQEQINTIIAETEKENISSHNVLIKNGFKKYKEEETIWWKLNEKY